MLIMLGTGAIMWNEREMPARWYELLRERMQVEQLRMRIVKHGYLIEDYELQELLTEAHSLDAEMVLVMRQTIAETLAREEVLTPAGGMMRPTLSRQIALARMRRGGLRRISLGCRSFCGRISERPCLRFA